jgi:hypothetical protein
MDNNGTGHPIGCRCLQCNGHPYGCQCGQCQYSNRFPPWTVTTYSAPMPEPPPTIPGVTITWPPGESAELQELRALRAEVAELAKTQAGMMELVKRALAGHPEVRHVIAPVRFVPPSPPRKAKKR